MKTAVYAELEVLKVPVKSALEVDVSNNTTKFVIDGDGNKKNNLSITDLANELKKYGEDVKEGGIQQQLPVASTADLLDSITFNLDKVFIAGKYTNDTSDIESGTKFGFKISADFSSIVDTAFFALGKVEFTMYSSSLEDKNDGGTFDDVLEKLKISEVRHLLDTYLGK